MSPEEILIFKKFAAEHGMLPMGDLSEMADAQAAGRPKVRLPGENRELGHFARDVGEILCKQNIFRRDLVPVTVNVEKKRTDPVDAEWLRSWSEYHLVCFKEREVGTGKDARMIEVVKTMNLDSARGTLRSPQFFQQLNEIERVNPIRLPLMTRDGRIELAPLGYCKNSRIYTLENDVVYDLEMELPRACEIVKELLAEFPFHDQGRSLAVQVAAMLTVFAPAILPKSAARPGFIYTANDSDAGKTLAVKCAVVPILGQLTIRAMPRSEELRKVLDQIAMEGATTILFDNVKGTLGGEDLEAFMSTPRWSGRILGEKGGFEVDNVTTCFFTGNDSKPTGDMANRCLFIELFLEHVDSSQRKIARVLNDRVLAAAGMRSDVCSALWAMVRHWDAQGRPKGAGTMPKCPEWSEIIGGIVTAAGFVDCCAKPQIANAGGDAAQMQTLVRALAPGTANRCELPFTEVVQKIKELELFERSELKNKSGDVLELYDVEGKLTPAGRSHFGKILRGFNGRLFIGEELDRLIWSVEGSKDTRKFCITRQTAPAPAPAT